MPTSGHNGRRGDKGGREKGEATAVSEADRVRFTTTLKEVRDGAAGSFEFPSTLTTAQRAFIHGLATKYGLVSKSHGKGEARAIVVSQPRVKALDAAAAEGFPWVSVSGREGWGALEGVAHLREIGVSREEIGGSRERERERERCVGCAGVVGWLGGV